MIGVVVIVTVERVEVFTNSTFCFLNADVVVLGGKLFVKLYLLILER